MPIEASSLFQRIDERHVMILGEIFVERHYFVVVVFQRVHSTLRADQTVLGEAEGRWIYTTT